MVDGNKIIFGRGEDQEKPLCGLWGVVILIPYPPGLRSFYVPQVPFYVPARIGKEDKA